MRRLLVPLLLCIATAAPSAQAPNARPNVILIITDDVGYGDIGSYGAPDIRTPNIDRLAARGTRFTDFYANGSTCTPTRAGLISGRYQQRFELERPLSSATTNDGGLGLPVTGRSLPQLLKNHGYATALIGKWHLGYLPQFSPKMHGFDTFWGYKSGYVDYYRHTDGAGQHDLFDGETPTKADGYMTDLITERSVNYITAHARAPFFLEVAYGAAHWPYQVPDQPSVAERNAVHMLATNENTGTRQDYVKMMERADAGVGQIVAAIETAGGAANTLIIFTNDNGGEWLSRNTPLFNRKYTLWEGGIRVPAIVSWPGRLPAGRVTPQVAITMDLSATILAAAGATVPPDARLEGINLLPIIEGTAAVTDRTLFWRVRVSGIEQRAVRSGNWKLLHEGGVRLSLFDLSNDISERNDLAASRTDIVRRLNGQLLAWEKDVDGEAKSRAGK
ncbi:MAG: sulfatase [Acidimicrobiia bacterium]